MSVNYLLIAHEFLCFALLYTVFCRCLKTDYRVRLDIRLAFFALGIVACAGIVAPICWGIEASAFELVLLLAIVVVQVATSRYWIKSVPESFLRPEFVKRRRRSSDLNGEVMG